MRLRESLRFHTRRLSMAGLPTPRLEAELLAASVLGCTRLALATCDDRELTAGEAAALDDACSRRERGEPAAYITGRREFYGRDYRVTPATLIPRPDTETLVEVVLARMDGERPEGDRAAASSLAAPRETGRVTFADLGTGSGCIGVTLCLERPGWQGLLLEKDGAAAKVAQANALALGAANARVLQGDIFALPLAPQSLDLVVANPPYIAPEERPSLMREVADHEPAAALFSGDGGLAHIAAIARQAATILGPGGLLALEHGMSQAGAVRETLRRLQFEKIVTEKDLAGLDRVTSARI